MLGRFVAAGARTLATLVDLVLPGDCAACGSEVGLAGVCTACLAVLAEPPAETRPTPAPEGLPRCIAVGGYDGRLRELILAYKERGHRGLASPLGDALAAAVNTGVRASRPLALVPVPATASAMRARHGDHMLRLAQRAARRLRERGRPIGVVTALRALPRTDSAHLDRRARAANARTAFVLRPSRVAAVRSAAEAGVQVVLLDDVLTTGATLAAVAHVLADAGVPVEFAATVAATRLRHVPSPEAINAAMLDRSGSLSPIAQISWDGSGDGGDGRPRKS